MWSTYTWVLVVALAAAGNWVTDPRTGKKYYIEKEGRNRLTAIMVCKRKGALLPEPRDKAEHEFLARNVAGTFWLGMEDQRFDNDWRWSRDNSKIYWFNWLPLVTPSDMLDCAVMMHRRTAGWVDYDCMGNEASDDIRERHGVRIDYVVCEKEATKKREWTTDPATELQYTDMRTPGMKQAVSQEACKSIGGFLPEPKTQKENTFLIENFLKPDTLGEVMFWLGVKKNLHTWEWSDSLVSWSNWMEEKLQRSGMCAGLVQKKSTFHPKPYFTYGWRSFECSDFLEMTTVVCQKGRSLYKPAPEPATGPEWTTDPETGKQYVDLRRKAKPQESNQKACKDIGAFLPEPKNKRENDFLASLETSAAFRLGLRQRDGAWRWDSDGSVVGWTNWAQALVAHYRCAVTGHTNARYDHGDWLDIDCTSLVGTGTIVCEKEATTKPTKPGIWMTHQKTGKQYKDMGQRGKSRGGNQDACSKDKAYMPEPLNEEENDFLKNVQGKSFRLGMTYIVAQGHWRWDRSYTNVEWFNWIQAPGDNHGPSGKHCAALVQVTCKGFDFKGWSPVNCTSALGTDTVVCEKNPNDGYGFKFAAAKADGKLHPPALLMSVALGLCRLIHYM